MKWRSLKTPADTDELLSHSSQSATCLHLVRQVFVIKRTQDAPLIKAASAGARARLVPPLTGRRRADTARCRCALHGQTAQLWAVSSLTAPWARRHAPRLSSRVDGALILMTAHGSTGLVPLTPTVRAQPRAASVRATITLNQVETDRQKKKSYQRLITTTIIIITSAGLPLWRRRLFRSLLLEAFVGDLLCVS